MLGKLLKYDLRSTFRLFPILLFGVAGLYLLGLVFNFFDITQLRVTFSFFLGVLAAAALIVSQIVLVVRFYKGMFGSQGYLDQTLPVSSGSLILSKMIAAVLMMLACAGLAILAVLAILHLNDSEFILIDIIKEVFGSTIEPLVIFYIVTFIISFFLFAAEIFFAIALAHTRPFIKNSGIMSVVFYFAINTIVGIIDLLAMLFIPFGVNITSSGFSWTANGTFKILANPQMLDNMFFEFTLGVGNWFTEIAAIVALLLVANWLIKNKTSVK